MGQLLEAPSTQKITPMEKCFLPCPYEGIGSPAQCSTILTQANKHAVFKRGTAWSGEYLNRIQEVSGSILLTSTIGQMEMACFLIETSHFRLPRLNQHGSAIQAYLPSAVPLGTSFLKRTSI